MLPRRRPALEGQLLVASADPAVLVASRVVNTHLVDRRPELHRTPELKR